MLELNFDKISDKSVIPLRAMAALEDMEEDKEDILPHISIIDGNPVRVWLTERSYTND